LNCLCSDQLHQASLTMTAALGKKDLKSSTKVRFFGVPLRESSSSRTLDGVMLVSNPTSPIISTNKGNQMTDIHYSTLKPGDKFVLDIASKTDTPITRYGTYLTDAYCALDTSVSDAASKNGYATYTTITGVSCALAENLLRTGIKAPPKDKTFIWPLNSGSFACKIRRVYPKDGDIKASDLLRGDRIELLYEGQTVKATYLGEEWCWLDGPMTTTTVHSTTPSSPFCSRVASVKSTVLPEEPKMWHLSLPSKTTITKFLPEKSNLVDRQIIPAAAEEVETLRSEIGGLKSEMANIQASLASLVSGLKGKPKSAEDTKIEAEAKEEVKGASSISIAGLAFAGMAGAVASAMMNKTPGVRVSEPASFAEEIAETATQAMEVGS
jgi:hypothetical protein